jgi:hypothetical protein
MNGVDQKQGWARTLVLLSVGALLSGLPLILSLRSQTRPESNKHTEQERQLDALAGYVRTCNQVNLDGRQLLATLDHLIEYRSDTQRTDEIGAEMKAHSLEYNLQIEIVNLTFGEQIEPFSSAPAIPTLTMPGDWQNPFDVGALRQEIAALKAVNESEEKACEANAKRLLNRIKSSN